MVDVPKLLAEQERVLSGLPDWRPNVLKRKYLVGKCWQSRPHTCNHGGNCGRAARRVPGWRKHAKGPANVPFSA